MNKLDQQLRRLLRAAATAPRTEAGDPGTAPDAQSMLRERDRQLARTQFLTRSLLRAGLAAACLLLMATLLASLRHIEQTNQDVFAVSEMVLTRISAP